MLKGLLHGLLVGAIIALILTALCCQTQKEKPSGPFKTAEWKDCFEECKSSLPKNLSISDFDNGEIKKMNPDELCVRFCTQALYHRRGIQ